MSLIVELVAAAQAPPRADEAAPGPLDELGAARAAALAHELTASDPDVRALCTAPSPRCRATLVPLAAASGLEVEVVEALGWPAEIPTDDAGDAWVDAAWEGGRALRFLEGRLAEAARYGRSARLVACAPAEVVAAVTALLAGRDGLDLADVHCPDAGRFTLAFTDGRATSAVRRPPPPARRRQES